MHKFTWAGYEGQPRSTVIRPDLMDRLDFYSAKLRERGIFYGWSHIYGHRPRPADRERLLAYDEIVNIKVPWSHLNASTSGLVNFAPDLQELSIELSVNMLNHRNPYTGLHYADDPALAFMELQNEDDIFWSAIEPALKQVPTYRALLNRQFSEWLRRKYGSHQALVAAWGADALADGEHLNRNNLYPRPNLDSLWNREDQTVHSSTGQLIWQYADSSGFVTVNTPGTKGVIGFAGGRSHALDGLELRVENPFAVVLVTSLDRDAPIDRAERILVTTVARARNTGMRYNADRTQLLEVGGAPLLMEPVHAVLSVKRRGLPTVHVLDHVGRRTGRTIPVRDGMIELDGPLHRVIYYELDFGRPRGL